MRINENKSVITRFIRFYKEYIKKQQWKYFIGLVTLAITSWLCVFIPKMISSTIDLIAQKSEISGAVAVIMLSALVTMVIRTLSRAYFFNPSRLIQHILRMDVYEKLLKQPKSYYDQTSTGDLINLVMNDTDSIRALLGYGLLQLFNVSFTLTLALWQMIQIDLLLSLYCLVPLFVAALILRKLILKIFDLSKQSILQASIFNQTILDSLSLVSAIQSFNVFHGVFEGFDQENQKVRSLQTQIQAIVIWGYPIVTIVGGLCVVMVLSLGGALVTQKQISMGQLTAMIVYINLLSNSLTSLGWFSSAIQRGMLSLQRLQDFMDKPINRPDPADTMSVQANSNLLLELKDVSFSYESKANHLVLDQVSFRLNRGEKLGIFGKTGAGKSTLLELLVRNYELSNQGSIALNGVDIQAYPITDYQKSVLLVRQKPFLFSQRVIDNICLRLENIDENQRDRLNRIVEQTCLSNEIQSFTDGLNTVVGEKGISLSGGQKQRIALARAFFLEDFELLLLDDVLSAVDHATEKKLIQAIDQKKCSTIIVSHRMSVLQKMDQIIVLDAGKIIERGTHQELIEMQGLYAQAWLTQEGQE
jgi:ATP-binding cassette subfamily B multidrug efflux pump